MSTRLTPRIAELGSAEIASRKRPSSGGRIEYVEVGGDDARPSTATVVYFHGAGGVFRNAAFLPALGQRYRVFAPSRPGFDGSTGDCTSAREEADVMRAFVRQVVSGPVHV